MNAIDIVIPTIRSPEEIAPLAEELASTAGVPVCIHATCMNVCAARNRNIGLDQCQSDIVIMVDDDMEGFPQGWAISLVEVLTSHPKCVMVSPQLAKKDGSPGCMMGGCSIAKSGVTKASERKLPTACVAVRNNAIRFDESYVGSGWEDDDYAAQLRTAFPDCEFLVCHDVWIVHRNEAKNQRGPHWERNKSLFESKWKVKDSKHQ